jgi:hypothetical protein
MQLRKLWRKNQKLPSVIYHQAKLLWKPTGQYLKKDLYLYRMTSVPEQLASDSAQRLQFLNKLHNDDASLKKTVFLVL